ncbi:WhiB family transcriptional regulator [Mycobacterium avium]|uniref:WhiB family transcriptional regulator n=1 Tax=Mycobacterium avium TaxID=1764 RepID=UPI003CC7F01E
MVQGHRDVPLGSDSWSFHHRDSRDGPLTSGTDTPPSLTPLPGTLPCAGCPVRRQCLAAALERAEPWGVWGGEILDRGAVLGFKRSRGRPRKDGRRAGAAA